MVTASINKFFRDSIASNHGINGFFRIDYSRLNDSSTKGLLRCDPAHQFIYFNEKHNWCSHLLLSIKTLNFLVQLEGVSKLNLAVYPLVS